jgi:hypothetical protein
VPFARCFYEDSLTFTEAIKILTKQSVNRNITWN